MAAEPSLEPALNYRNAALRIGRHERTVRRLVTVGRLLTIGSGQKRQITVASLEQYLDEERRKLDTTTDILSTVSAVSEYQESMQHLLKILPPLSSPISAARRLGIPPVQFERLMASGDVPSIGIGGARFVPRHWMAAILTRANQPQFEKETK